MPAGECSALSWCQPCGIIWPSCQFTDQEGSLSWFASSHFSMNWDGLRVKVKACHDFWTQDSLPYILLQQKLAVARRSKVIRR